MGIQTNTNFYKYQVDVAQKPKDEVKSNDEDLLDINDTPIQNPINESNLIIGENEPDAVPEKDDQIPNDSKLIPSKHFIFIHLINCCNNH